MNLNKSLACLLSAATFISSMPNIEAEDNKFKKVFNTIINSKPALCAIGASGLAAIIGGGVLIAHNRKTKKANSKSKTDNYTVKKVKFRLKNSPQDEWPQGAKEVLCKLERAEGCPNAICIKLPDPKDSATASFLLQNLKLNELKTKLEKLLTENTGSVDLNEKYVMSLEPSEGDDTKLPQLNLTEYMNALDQTYQAHEKRGHGSDTKAPKSAAAEGPSSTPEQPEHGGDASTKPDPQTAQKKPIPAVVPQTTVTEGSEGTTEQPETSKSVAAGDLNDAAKQSKNEGDASAKPDLQQEQKESVPAVVPQTAAAGDSDGAAKQPGDGGSNGTHSSSQQEQQEFESVLKDEEIEKTYKALCDTLEGRNEDGDDDGEKEAARIKQLKKALPKKLSGESTDNESTLSGKKFHIITIGGVTDCKYVMYKVGDADEYYVLPYPEHRDSSKEKPPELSLQNEREIYKLATSMEDTEGQKLSDVVAKVDGASLHELELTGDAQGVKNLIRSNCPCSLEFTGNCGEADNLVDYKGDILKFYKKKIKQNFFPNLKSNASASVHFYQLSRDSIVKFDVGKMKQRQEQVDPQENVYVLPSRDSDLHLLIAPENRVREFLGKDKAFNQNGQLLYQDGVSNEEEFFEMMLEKNFNRHYSMTQVDDKFGHKILISSVPGYVDKEKQIKQRRAEEERQRKEEEDKKRREEKEARDRAEEEDRSKQRQRNCEKIKNLTEWINRYFEDKPDPDIGADTTEHEQMSSGIFTESTTAPPSSSPVKNLIKQFQSGDAASPKKLKKVYLEHTVDLNRLIVSPDIDLADGNTLELRGKKCIKAGLTSKEVRQNIQEVAGWEPIEFCRLGTFLKSIGKCLDDEGLNITKLTFRVCPSSAESEFRGATKFKFEMRENKELVCLIDEDYLLNGTFYNIWHSNLTGGPRTQRIIFIKKAKEAVESTVGKLTEGHS